MNAVLAELSYSLANIDAAAEKFWNIAGHYRLLAFSGDMGAGKTTFISSLCHYLRVQDTVTSPTFALVNEYHFAGGNGEDNTIFHIDLYRLKDANEAINAGMEDCIEQAKNGSAWCFIEWPEKAEELLYKPFLWISIESTDIDERKMTITLTS